MNVITVTLKDRTKTASCRETVALCAKYALTVSPALEVDEDKTETIDGVLTSTVKGYIVLHRRFVGRTPPDGSVRFVAGQQVADQNYQWDTNEVYGYSELTTRKIDGKWVTTGELDLRTKTLCRDFIQKFGANANAPLKFAIYDPVAGGMVGEGEFDVKVVEPYYISPDKSLTLFKGDRGDKGDKGDDGLDMTWDSMTEQDKVAFINSVAADLNIINDITRDSTKATLINRTDGQEDNAIVTIGSVDKQSNLAGLMTVEDKKTLDLHVANTDNPHGVTAEQVGAVSSHSGSELTFSWEPNNGGIALLGNDSGIGLSVLSGGCGFYALHGGYYDWYKLPTGKSGTLAIVDDISATNPTFSDAVLAVGLNIDNETLQWLKDIGAIAGSTTGQVGIGTLLASILAALMWLKKNKVGSFASVGGATATVENGVAKLDDFFTNSNSLLTGTIDAEVISKGTAPDAHLEAPTDERLKLVLADNSVAYDSAKALPYKLTSVIGDRVIATMTLTAASTDITLPTIAANDTTVKDFILDVTNAYGVEGVATDAGINIPRTDFKLVTRDGESLTDVTTVKAGKSAFLCFTQKAPVVVGGTTYPCWCVIQLPFGDPS